MRTTIITLTLMACFEQYFALDIPKTFKKCSRSDSKLSDCITDSANKGWAAFCKDKDLHVKYRIASLDPLEADRISMNLVTGLSANGTDVKMKGLSELTFENINLDLEKKRLDIRAFVPTFSIECQYVINGRLLFLPIQGSGYSKVVYSNSTDKIGFDFDIIDKKGKQYIHLLKASHKSERGHISIRMDNLFNGDKFLGDQMVKLMNDNWKDIDKETAPGIEELMSGIYINILEGFFSKIPISDLLSA